MLLSPAMFAHLTHHMMALATGRVCVALEVKLCLLQQRYSISPNRLTYIPEIFELLLVSLYNITVFYVKVAFGGVKF